MARKTVLVHAALGDERCAWREGPFGETLARWLNVQSQRRRKDSYCLAHEGLMLCHEVLVRRLYAHGLATTGG